MLAVGSSAVRGIERVAEGHGKSLAPTVSTAYDVLLSKRLPNFRHSPRSCVTFNHTCRAPVLLSFSYYFSLNHLTLFT